MAATRSRGTPGVRLDEATWIKIQSRYERGESVRGMAREFGVNAATIVNKGKKLGWLGHGELKAEALEEARSAIKEIVKKTYTEEVKIAQGRHLQLSRAVQKMGAFMLQTIGDNVKEPDPAKKKQINREIYQLNILSQTLGSAINIERMSLGMENFKPDEEKDGFSKFIDSVNQMRERREVRESKALVVTTQNITDADFTELDIPEVPDE